MPTVTEPTDRADYAPTNPPELGAWVKDVAPGSPADDAGVVPGMRVDRVAGVVPTDVISWMWEASEGEVEVEVYDPVDGTTSVATLEREPGQDWGIEFSDVLFDGVRTCRNACVFCFMSMLPARMRDTLYLRDDDYRLSFLQGNFVTLTNLGDEDVERIVSCRLEPMNVSLHAVDHDVRRRLLGANEGWGIDALERLCAAGIEVHAQIVLCPGINDGVELEKTLSWVEGHESITSLAIVPMGYTRFSSAFTRSYSDDAAASREVIELVRPYQERARSSRGMTLFQLSDEFYLDANVEVPAADTYDGFPQFYDGIGMLRSFMDESDDVLCSGRRELEAISRSLVMRGLSVDVICGEAAEGVISRFLSASPLADRVHARAIRNDYFGGDVNVTGLIVGTDLLAQLPGELGGHVLVLPDTMFNSDDVTLDDTTYDSIARAVAERNGAVLRSTTTPSCLVDAIASAVAGRD